MPETVKPLECWLLVWWGGQQRFDSIEAAEKRIKRLRKKEKWILFHVTGDATAEVSGIGYIIMEPGAESTELKRWDGKQLIERKSGELCS